MFAPSDSGALVFPENLLQRGYVMRVANRLIVWWVAAERGAVRKAEG